DELLRSHVYVRALAGGEERKVEGEDFLMSSGAKWTPDGKKLLLLGGVGAPGMASLNRSTMQLYSVALTHIEKNPDDRDVDTEEQAQTPQTPVRRGRNSNTNTLSREESTDEEGESPRRTNSSASAKVEVKIE